MRVGVVARCLNGPHIRGMGRYVYELLQQSAGAPELEWVLLSDDPSRPMVVPPGLRARREVFSFRGDRFQAWEQLGLPLRTRRHGGLVDVLHCTEGSLPLWQPVPTVVTLHDTLAWAPGESPGTPRLYLDRVQPAALARCKAVITISESSRRDIVAKWPALAPRLVVIPHGIAREYLDNDPGTPSALQARMATAPYLVYLGGPMPRKRFDWALEVLAQTGVADLHLIAIGFAAATHGTTIERVPASLRSRVHFAPFLNDAELLALYRGAVAVLYPTLYEGFGFPAVEAQAAGVPAIFSAVASLAELVGPLARVVDPYDFAAWCHEVRRALSERGQRHAQAEEARNWAGQFSWRRSYEAHLAVYQEAAAR